MKHALLSMTYCMVMIMLVPALILVLAALHIISFIVEMIVVTYGIVDAMSEFIKSTDPHATPLGVAKVLFCQVKE
jgi:hypothetical protein